MLVGKCFSHLLRNPEAVRMAGDIEVQNAPAIMSNHEEAIEHTKRERRNGEEIHCRDHFTMVTQKCFPSPASITKPGCTSHPARDRSLGDIKSKLQQFTVNPRRTPGRILGDHPENQCAQFPADSPSATADLVAATPAPIAAKSCPMPAHHRLRSDDQKGALPLRPDLAHAHPEQPIGRCQLESLLAALENGKLLTKGQILQQKIFTGTKAATQQADEKLQQAEHGPDLYQMPTVRLTAMSLNSKPDRILAKH